MSKKRNKPSAGGAPGKPEVAPADGVAVPETKPRSEKSKDALVLEIRSKATRVLNQMREVARLQIEGCGAALQMITVAKDHLDPAQAQLVANELSEQIGALVVLVVALNRYVANAPKSSRSATAATQANGAPPHDPESPAEASILARAREKLRQARNNKPTIPTPHA